MRALQYTAFGRPPEIREVPIPQPGPGEVLIKTTAAGVCHSDEYFMSLPPEEFTTPLPLTLGHEGAGIVAGLGSAVSGIREGDAVAVYGAWGCGSCRACAAGAENYCIGARRPVAGYRCPRVHGRLPARAKSAASRPARRPRPGPVRPAHGRRAHAVPRDQAVAAQARPGLDGRCDRRGRSRPPRDPAPERPLASAGRRARHQRGQARLRS